MSSNIRISLLRASDLLNLEFDLVNLKLASDGSRLTRIDPDTAAFVIVHFPPQALTETVFTTPPPLAPVRTVLSGPSRLVFRLPDGELPLTVVDLLNWSKWQPVVAPTALPRGTQSSSVSPEPRHANRLETSIEFPWRLAISPDSTSYWQTNTAATTSPREQLWSALLIPTTPMGPNVTTPPVDVRALGVYEGPDFPTSLTPQARHDILDLTGNFHLPDPTTGGKYTPEPISARHLELTSLGAYTDFEADWDYPIFTAGEPPGFKRIDLRRYEHKAALGRDSLVRTVELGWLCGTGHTAVRIETVQRIPADLHAGYLMKQTDITVLKPYLDYRPITEAFAYKGHELPFQTIELTTTTAQILEKKDPASADPEWLLKPDGSALLFNAVGTDITGGTVNFSLPLMFVPYEAITEDSLIHRVFNQPPDSIARAVGDHKRIRANGQPIAVAPPGKHPGSTTLILDSFTYDIEQPPNNFTPPPQLAMKLAGAPAWYYPRFLPYMTGLNASVPAVNDLTGSVKPVDLTLDPTWLKHGFEPANRAQTFVRMASPLPIILPGQSAGGLASLNTAAEALSCTFGAVANPDKLQEGKVDLSAFTDTKILGTIPLLKLIPVELPLDLDTDSTSEPPEPEQLNDPKYFVNPPRLITRRSPSGVAVPELVESRFVWKPYLQEHVDLAPLVLDLGGADFLLDVTTCLVQNKAPSATAIGRLRNIDLIFANALRVHIEKLCFRAEAGRKIAFGASEVKIKFEGPLTFVNTLQSILPAAGFDDPPYVTADSQGVVAGYTLGVPNVAVGIFSLQNIALDAALSIPFTGRPAGLRFAISQRHKPFLVTVSLFGGGGFFAVEASAEGLESVEASLEFGGNISLNLGVASGGVSVMSGIYFGMTGTSVTLTGYLRCSGHLNILGLISLALEFYLAFTYRNKKPGSEVWGQASLYVAVKVLFFSTSVKLSIERRFSGADGDPSFADTVGPPEWARYLQAFA